VAVASAGLYAMLTPFDLLRGNTWVHLIPHSTHPQSSSLHGAVKAGRLSEIEKRALPPPCFPSFNFQSTRSQGATLALLPGGVWGFGAFQTVHVCNLQGTENDVRSKEKT